MHIKVGFISPIFIMSVNEEMHRPLYNMVILLNLIIFSGSLRPPTMADIY